MQARVDLHDDRVWLERGLAVAAAAAVAGLMTLTSPSDWEARGVEPYGLLAAMMGIGAWLPLLGRRRWSAVGELCREGDWLVFRGGSRTRWFALRCIHGVRVARGSRGASVIMQLDTGGVLAAALDDVEDARHLAGEIGGETADANVLVRGHRLGLLPTALRAVTTLFSLAYYVAAHSHGDFVFPAVAMVSGVLLALLHLVRHRRVPLDLALSTRGYASTLRSHLQAHALADPTEKPPPLPRTRLVDLGEPLGAWLARTRRELADPDAYRGASQAIRAKLEHALGTTEVPLRERALALRIIAAGDASEVRRRIADGPALVEEDRAWVEAVALAEDDGGALAKVARRAPDFVG